MCSHLGAMTNTCVLCRTRLHIWLEFLNQVFFFFFLNTSALFSLSLFISSVRKPRSTSTGHHELSLVRRRAFPPFSTGNWKRHKHNKENSWSAAMTWILKSGWGCPGTGVTVLQSVCWLNLGHLVNPRLNFCSLGDLAGFGAGCFSASNCGVWKTMETA